MPLALARLLAIDEEMSRGGRRDRTGEGTLPAVLPATGFITSRAIVDGSAFVVEILALGSSGMASGGAI